VCFHQHFGGGGGGHQYGWSRQAFDNIFVERRWRTVQYKDISIKEYGTVHELEGGLEHTLWFYHHERPHQALGYHPQPKCIVKRRRQRIA
jgi:integrase-like protein